VKEKLWRCNWRKIYGYHGSKVDKNKL